MKYFVVNLVSLISFLGILAQKTDLKDSKLKGRVKSITRISYSQEPGEERRFKVKSSETYNEKGYLVEYSSYDMPSGPSSFYITRKYDAKGFILVDSSFGEHHNFLNKALYKYDQKGNKIEYKEFDDKGSVNFTNKFTFDNRGNMLSFTQYTADGKIKFIIKYSYDLLGNMTALSNYKPDGTLNGQYTYTFDKNGNMVSERSNNPGLKEQYYTVSTFDKEGNVLTSEKFSSSKVLLEKTIFDYTFDSQKNWISRTASTTTYYGTKGASYVMDELSEQQIIYYK